MSKFLKYLNEGGAYGHLSNIWDVNFTFSELKQIIKDSLSGKLELTKEKTDGQNITFTWKNNTILFARNKTQLKNFGDNAMTLSELSSKFSGRGSLEKAFTLAGTDLQNAVSKLSEKEKIDIFKNGQKFMSCEILYPENPNIIPYGVYELRFHGTKEYDQNGNEINDFKSDSDKLANILKKINQNKQKNFEIKSLKSVDVFKSSEYKKQESELISLLNDLMKKNKISNSNTIREYKVNSLIEIMKKKDIPIDENLLKRWIDYDKSYTIKNIKKAFASKEDTIENILTFDKNVSGYIKQIILPLEKIFLKLGAYVLKNIKNVMALNPDQAVQQMKKRFESAIDTIQSTNNPKMLDKLKLELDRFESLGGIDYVVPMEGITFLWKGNFLKLTGSFAVLNQLINLLWKIK